MFGVLKLGKLGASMKKAGLNPRTLFSASEPGAWYDPSDMSTLFQDAAGTTPVTAVEQPVGRILDKSGRGNHAFQATATSRPVLSARYNLLTKTEQFNDAAWSLAQGLREFGAGSVANTTETTDPLGGNAADKLVEISGSITSAGIGLYLGGVAASSGVQYTATVYAKAAGRRYAILAANGVPTGAGAWFDLQDGVVTATAANNLARSITSVGEGWWRLSITFLTTTAAAGCSFNFSENGTSNAYTGDGTKGIYIWGASLVPADQSSLPYQRVNTATDYDADPAKFPAYRRADGVDDSLASSTGGGGTTGFFFSAAISPQGSAGTARTLFSDAGTNTGYIVRLNTRNQLELAAGNGTAYTTIATVGTLAVSATDVVQAWDDGTTLNVKTGSGPTASIARPVVSAGTAGYTLYQDNGASTGYFNGRSYGEIYRKDSGLTQSQREAVAVYQRKKARIA